MPPKIRNILAILLISLLLALNHTYFLSADSPEEYINQLKINGANVRLDPPAIISNNRTMVPVRFIAENQAFSGQVYWDEQKQKVAMDCHGHYIELFIGSKKAFVDGQEKSLDEAPFIWHNRTYIPLRFLSENLDANVFWNAVNREISINFDSRPRVFAYYYYSPTQEVQKNSQLFSDVAFRWLTTDGEGNLSYEYQDQYSQKVQWIRGQGILAHASVALMDSEQLHQLLTSSKNRQRLIKQLVSLTYEVPYDGVNIDFEFIRPEDGPSFTLFLQELKAALGSEKLLSAAVFARTGNENWATAYDYKAIGAAVDLVVVMAYDYSYKDSDPGPVAPFWWVEQVSSYMQSKVPKDKILMGLATYGYDWSSDGQAKTINAGALKKLQAAYKVQEHFDQASLSPYYTYYDEKGNYHQLWMENQRSLATKWTLCLEQDLGGVAFWRIGTGFADLYNVLAGS